MDKKSRNLIGAYLKKADDKLQVAETLLRMRDYEDAVSRAYYAAFYSVQAVLLTAGLSARTHQGLVYLFGLHFVKTGKLEKKLGRLLAELKDDREKSDYEVYSTIDKKTAARAVAGAREFLNGIRKYLRKSKTTAR